MLYLVRHGETVWNRLQRLQGRLDSPLTLRGVQLAIGYGEHLRSVVGVGVPVSIHTSPMGRARQTATLLADCLGVDADRIAIADDLAEHDVGDWAGRTWGEITRETGSSTAQLRDWDTRPPSGETRREMSRRAQRWLAAERAPGAHVVVSHGGLSRVLRGAHLGLTPTATSALPVHDHGRLYRLDEGSVVEIVTDSTVQPLETLLG